MLLYPALPHCAVLSLQHQLGPSSFSPELPLLVRLQQEMMLISWPTVLPGESPVLLLLVCPEGMDMRHAVPSWASPSSFLLICRQVTKRMLTTLWQLQQTYHLSLSSSCWWLLPMRFPALSPRLLRQIQPQGANNVVAINTFCIACVD